MPIATAIKRGSQVQVIDERGRAMFSLVGELHGFTGATVSVRQGIWVSTYDERGRKLSTLPSV